MREKRFVRFYNCFTSVDNIKNMQIGNATTILRKILFSSHKFEKGGIVLNVKWINDWRVVKSQMFFQEWIYYFWIRDNIFLPVQLYYKLVRWDHIKLILSYHPA